MTMVIRQGDVFKNTRNGLVYVCKEVKPHFYNVISTGWKRGYYSAYTVSDRWLERYEYIGRSKSSILELFEVCDD